MNEEIKYFIFVILTFGLASIIFQSIFVPLIEINVWRPDFVLIIVLLMGKRFGSMLGSTAGFVLGIVQDSLSGMPVGITALPKAVAGYASGKLRPLPPEGTAYYLWFVLFILMHELISFLFFHFKSEVAYSLLIYSRVFPNTIYTTIMLVIITVFSKRYFKE